MSPKRPTKFLTALLILANAGWATAEVRIEPLAPPLFSSAPVSRTAATGLVATVAASFAEPTRAARTTTDVLLLPYFEVEPDNPAGTTTLFAVRNETADPLAVRVLFLSPIGPDQQVAVEFALVGHAVHTFNLRDVRGLQTDGDGVARGLVVLGVIGGGAERGLLTGDFFLLRDVAATGGALLNLSINDPNNELCQAWSTRFLNGGSFAGSTILTIVADVAQGVDDADPATVIATVYAEDGTETARFAVKSDSNAFRLDIRDLVPPELPFGSLSLDFPATRGAVLVEHATSGGYRVGLKGGCVLGE